MESLRSISNKVIGTKQTLRALENETVEAVYIALDAELKVTASVRALAIEKGVEVVEVLTMNELGKACGIKVSAACVAVLK